MRSSPLLLLDLLVALQPRLEFSLDEVAHAGVLPTDALPVLQFLFLGAGVVHRRFPGHFEREAVAFLGGAQRRRVLTADVARDRHGLVLEARERHRVVDEAHTGGGLAVETAAGETVEQGITWAEKIGQRLAHATAGEALEVNLRETKGCLLGGN